MAYTYCDDEWPYHRGPAVIFLSYFSWTTLHIFYCWCHAFHPNQSKFARHESNFERTLLSLDYDAAIALFLESCLSDFDKLVAHFLFVFVLPVLALPTISFLSIAFPPVHLAVIDPILSFAIPLPTLIC